MRRINVFTLMAVLLLAGSVNISHAQGRSAVVFNLADLEKQTDTFIEFCLDHPAEKAEAAMAQSKK